MVKLHYERVRNEACAPAIAVRKWMKDEG